MLGLIANGVWAARCVWTGTGSEKSFAMSILWNVILLFALCALISPTKPRWRESACKSNLRQVANSIYLYAETYDDRMPLAQRPLLELVKSNRTSQASFQCDFSGDLTLSWNANLAGLATSSIPNPEAFALVAERRDPSPLQSFLTIEELGSPHPKFYYATMTTAIHALDAGDRIAIQPKKNSEVIQAGQLDVTLHYFRERSIRSAAIVLLAGLFILYAILFWKSRRENLLWNVCFLNLDIVLLGLIALAQ